MLAASEYGGPLTGFEIRMIVKRLLDKSGRKIHIFPKNLPGRVWLLNFLSRYKNYLSQRSCKNIKGARADKTEDEINHYFDNLERTIEGIETKRVELTQTTRTRRKRLNVLPGRSVCNENIEQAETFSATATALEKNATKRKSTTLANGSD